MRILLRWPAAHETVQYHGLPAPVIDAYLDKEVAALILAVVKVDAAFLLPALRQVGA